MLANRRCRDGLQRRRRESCVAISAKISPMIFRTTRTMAKFRRQGDGRVYECGSAGACPGQSGEGF